MFDPRSEQRTAVPEKESLASEATPVGPELMVSARIDPAHSSGPEPNSATHNRVEESADHSEENTSPAGTGAVPDLLLETEGPGDIPVTQERLRRQARQLAEYLRRRQADLDRREARLNAQLAQLENDLRASRLLLAERLAEWEEKRRALADEAAAVARRRADLGEREEQLQQRESLIAQWEETLRRREQELREREEELERRRKDLLHREASVRLREEDLTALAVLVEPNSATPPEAVPGSGQRASHYEEAELRQLLEEARTLLKELREARKRFRQEERQWRRQWAEDQRRALAELEEQKEAIRRRGQTLAQFHEELVQLRREVEAKQLAALEHHLAAREVIAAVDPDKVAEITQKILSLRKERESLLREQAEEQQHKEQQLAELHHQTEELLKQVREEKARLETAIAARWEELDQLAQQLADQKRRLAEQAARLAEKEHAWRLHRLGYRTQIRELRRQLREKTERGSTTASSPRRNASGTSTSSAGSQD